MCVPRPSHEFRAFFSNILRKPKHPNIFIYLKGINRIELEYVVDFLYNSEVYIAQEDLSKFLEAAQELQVKGLQSKEEEECGENPTVKTDIPMCTHPRAKSEVEPNFTEKKTQNIRNRDTSQQERIFKSLEELGETFDTSDVAFVQTDEVNLVLNTNLELDLQIQQMIEKNEGL